EVTFLLADPDSPPGTTARVEELRASAVATAAGELVALLEDHVRPDPGWIEAIRNAHRNEEFAAIGGAVENGIDRILNWAVYFSDLGRYHNPLTPGESPWASLVNVSYKRASLNLVKSVWQVRFH